MYEVARGAFYPPTHGTDTNTSAKIMILNNV